MSNKNQTNYEHSTLTSNPTRVRKPFSKSIWMKVFSIILLAMLFLAPTLSLLINLINPPPTKVPAQPVPNIQIKK